jgi:hypothetical protein
MNEINETPTVGLFVRGVAADAGFMGVKSQLFGGIRLAMNS